MSLEKLPQHYLIKQAFLQNYQNRTPAEHNIAVSVIRHVFSQLISEQVKILSCFAELLLQGQQFSRQSVKLPSIFIQINNSGQLCKKQINTKQDLWKLDLTVLTIYISFNNKQKAQRMNNLQEEIKYLHKSRYFQDLSKKKLYHILRIAQLLTYSFGHNVYQEGQQLQLGEASVFLVRQGEFSFTKLAKDHHNIQLYEFGKGDIFGYEDDATSEVNRKRQFTVNCRSSCGIVYKFTEDFFNSSLKKNCQQILKINYQKINHFLSQQMLKIQKNRFNNSQLLSQTLMSRRSMSVQNTFLTIPKLIKSRVEEQLTTIPKKTSCEKLPVLTNKNTASSKKLSKADFVTIANPQYQQEANILNKKYKCDMLRNYYKGRNVKSKGEVLLSLIKHSWQFQRNKNKHIFK